jgi:hypothetical protein
MSRIFALSDIHVDLTENMAFLEALSTEAFQDDILILAGDVSHDLDRVAKAFACLQDRFARIFFVPGNHDLWVRAANGQHSIDRLEGLLDLCRRSGVETEPARTDEAAGSPWIVPLFSWYRMPEEGSDSLYVEKPGEDPELRMWSDRRFVRWPDLHPHGSPADYMHALNRSHLSTDFGPPVITFSHFLPRTELIFSTRHERRKWAHLGDPYPAFNFSRVAGCAGIDRQIRAAGASVHYYGHQHRNRCRHIDGVTYISHCLGYPREREAGRGPAMADGPRLVWDGELVLESQEQGGHAGSEDRSLGAAAG